MARDLKADAGMMKEKLHLGQVLTYDGRRAVVDALTQSCVNALETVDALQSSQR